MSASRKVSCILCTRSEETKLTGPLFTKGGVTAHQNCLLYSSGICCQNTPEYDDLFGFSIHHVREEVRRGNQLLCHKCRRKGATVGCEVKSCKRSYHYPCAVEDGAKSFEPYSLHCIKHQPLTSEQDASLENKLDISSSTPGKSKPPSGTGMTKVSSATCGKTKGNVRPDHLSPHVSSLKHTPSAFKKRRHSSPFKWEENSSKRETKHQPETKSEDFSSSDIGIFGPLESDIEENSAEAEKSAGKAPISPSQPPSGNLLQELGHKTFKWDLDDPSSPFVDKWILPVQRSKSLELLPPNYAEDPDKVHTDKKRQRVEGGKIDPVTFWKDCNAAGCTKAIFKDFIDEMKEIGHRIQSDKAFEEDYARALSVMEASGKLERIVDEQRQELQLKLDALTESMSALEKVVSALKK